MHNWFYFTFQKINVEKLRYVDNFMFRFLQPINMEMGGRGKSGDGEKRICCAHPSDGSWKTPFFS